MAQNLVVLVHGTHARDAEWVGEDAALAHSLRLGLPDCQVRTFRWSGANHHGARLQAGAELAMMLQSLCATWPAARLHLISHSHGGNVVLYAARRLDPQAQVATIAFLGTPFLNVRRRNITANSAQFALLASIVGAYLGFLLFAVAAVLVSILLPGNWGLGFVVVAALYGVPLGISTQAKMRTWIARWLDERLPRLQARHADLANQTGPGCPVYIATVPADEAGLLLHTLDRLSAMFWWPQRLVRLAGPGVVAAQGAALLVFASVSAVAGEGSPTYAASGAAWVYSFVAVATVGAWVMWLTPLAALIGAALRGSRFAFGGESPLFTMALRVSPDVRPLWDLPPGSRVLSLPPREGQKGLRHCGFYEDQVVVADMIAWMNGTAGAPPAEAVSRPPPPGRKLSIRAAAGVVWFCLVVGLAFVLGARAPGG
ncbi:hypothetical protein [Phenylobacterium sp.]|uniref:esterase/lipase family protein n=1 Tax=Phenylobacterium sp. TaxID=1871053 RepID=UPI0030F38094